MKRKELIDFLDKELENFLSLADGFEEYGNNGEKLLLKLEKLGVIKPPLEGDLKSQVAASYGKWEDE